MSLYKNTASQKWIVFAFNVTDNEPLAGDAANITGNLRLDGGVADAIDDVNPTELEDGYYAFDLTQAETNADLILIAPASSTASIKVIGVPGAQYTTPITLAAINAECDTAITDAALATAANLATAQTSINAIPTTAMRGTDSAALASVATEARLAELDAANLPADIAAIPTTAMRGTDSAYTGTPPTAAAIADQVWDELQSAHVTVGSFGIIASEIAAIPTTAMRGTDSAALASVATEARLAELDAANIPADVDAVKVVTDKFVFTTANQVDSNMLSINSTATSAARLALSADVIIPATVDTVTNTHTPTTTEFQADDITEATADHYNGRIVIFTSGVLDGQATDITDYVAVGGIGQFTVTALTEAPSNNDTFIIV